MAQRPEKDRDVYDGHADYRRDLEPKPPIEAARSFLRALLAIAITVAITRMAYKLLYPGQNILLLFTAGIAGIVGLIGGAVGYSFLNRDGDGESRPMGIGDVMAVAFFILAFVVPMSLDRAHDQREREARVVRMRAAEQERAAEIAQNREAGMASLRRRGRFAEPGIVPPDFEVFDDDGSSVTVTYRGEKSTTISLARVLRDPDSPGGWRGCELWTSGYRDSARHYKHPIATDMSLSFSMHKECIEEFHDAPLEFRVGEPGLSSEATERAWWSESAFAFPEGREKETLQRMAAASRTRLEQSPEQIASQRKEEFESDLVAAQSERQEVEPAGDPEPASAPAGTRDIIKCRDASGNFQFTQTYCPPGTIRVEIKRE